MDDAALARRPGSLGEALQDALLVFDVFDARGLDARGTVILDGLVLESGQR